MSFEVILVFDLILLAMILFALSKGIQIFIRFANP